MSDKNTNILLVEDNPGDTRLIKEMLIEPGGHAITLECADTLNRGLERLEKDGVDAVLLDLTLPDSTGLVTLAKVLEHSPDVAIVVLTGFDDEEAAMKAVHAGAQDYLVKGQINGLLLKRSIRYAIERAWLRAELDRARHRETAERESEAFNRLSGQGHTSVTAAMFGTGPLREASPEVFEKLVKIYEETLVQALEIRAYKVEHDISGQLRAISEELSHYRAGPRDVVEVHSEALKAKVDKAGDGKARAYATEGRLMLLELMGNLVLLYRNYVMGFSRTSAENKKKIRPTKKEGE